MKRCLFFICFYLLGITISYAQDPLLQNYLATYEKMWNLKNQFRAPLGNLELLKLKESQAFNRCKYAHQQQSCDALETMVQISDISSKDREQQLQKYEQELFNIEKQLYAKSGEEYTVVMLKKLKDQRVAKNESYLLSYRYPLEMRKSTLECRQKGVAPIICQIEKLYILTTVQKKINLEQNKKLLEDFYRQVISQEIEQRRSECSMQLLRDSLPMANPYRFSIEVGKVLKQQIKLEQSKDKNALYKFYQSLYPRSNFFHLRIKKGKTYNICTATQFKYNDRCYTVTNAHCIKDIDHPQIMLQTGKENEPPGFASRNIPVKIARTDVESDLLLLELPAEMKRQYCGRIKNVKKLTAHEIAQDRSIKIAVGKTRHGEVEYYNNFISSNKQLNGQIPHGRVIKSGLQHIDSFVELKYLDVGHGMSGGGIVNAQGDLLGITSRYIKYQDTPWIIPIDEVVAFATEEKYQSPIHTSVAVTNSRGVAISCSDNVPEQPNGNLPEQPNGNLPEQPNGNLPEQPNGNLPEQPNGNLPEQPNGMKIRKHLTAKEMLAGFMQKHEGVEIQEGHKTRKLIAVYDGQHWEQIDGKDDVLYKAPKQIQETKNKIFLDADGNIPVKYRDKTLSFLAGKYDYSHSSFSGREIVFTPDVHAIDGMRKLRGRNQLDKIEITAQHISLKFGIEPMKKFQVSYSDDKNIIYLQAANNEKLTCANKSLHKLICKGEHSALTISLSSTKQQTLSYGYVTERDGKYHYRFGDFINE